MEAEFKHRIFWGLLPFKAPHGIKPFPSQKWPDTKQVIRLRGTDPNPAFPLLLSLQPLQPEHARRRPGAPQLPEQPHHHRHHQHPHPASDDPRGRRSPARGPRPPEHCEGVGTVKTGARGASHRRTHTDSRRPTEGQRRRPRPRPSVAVAKPAPCWSHTVTTRPPCTQEGGFYIQFTHAGGGACVRVDGSATGHFTALT